MAQNETSGRQQSQSGSQTQVQSQHPDQQRQMSRREQYYPNFGGDLFSMSPFALLREMTDLMDRSFTGGTSASRGRDAMTWNPAVEVREQDGNLIVCADLPGIDQNDVKVEVEQDMLVIHGERKREHSEEKGGWRHSERSYGSFQRTIALPEGANVDKANADFKNGVLEIRIPLEQPKSNRRQIQIQAVGGSQSQSSSSQTGNAKGQTGTASQTGSSSNKTT